MNGADVVYLADLTLRPATTDRVYHRMDRRRDEWQRWVHDEETSARVGYIATKPVGEERHYTGCGLMVYRHLEGHQVARLMHAIRLDLALRLGARPCARCHA